MNETTTDERACCFTAHSRSLSSWDLTERQVRHRVADGEFPTFKIGGTVCARRASLVAWLAKREVEAQSAAGAARNARRAANRRAWADRRMRPANSTHSDNFDT